MQTPREKVQAPPAAPLRNYDPFEERTMIQVRAREAIQRARARQRRTADDYIAEGIAAKYARHRVLS